MDKNDRSRRLSAWRVALSGILLAAAWGTADAGDLDQDGVPDVEDNCPRHPNPLQSGSVQLSAVTVFSTRFTPDGSGVVYWRGNRLYRVPIQGGPEVPLTPPAPSEGGVEFYPTGFKISPDGQYVVWVGDATGSEARELYSAPLAGGPAQSLSGPMVAGCIPQHFEFTPDSATVVYRADQDVDELYELFAVPTAGGTPVRLNPPLPSDRDVWDFAVSPDGSRVAFTTNLEQSAVLKLYVSDLTGASVQQLAGLSVGIGRIRFTLGGNEILFLGAAALGLEQDLYRVPAGGGPIVQLTSNGIFDDFLVAPDGLHIVVYKLTTWSMPGTHFYTFDLYRVAAGSEPVFLDQFHHVQDGLIGPELLITPDSRWLVAGTTGVHAWSLTGSSEYTILSSARDTTSLALAADGTESFAIFQDSDSAADPLYAFSLSTGQQSLVASTGWWGVGVDNQRAVVFADGETGTLFVTSVHGGTAIPLGIPASVWNQPQIAPGGASVISGHSSNLYAAALDGDADGTPDVCDPCNYGENEDSDTDGWCDPRDNCPYVPNPEQEDEDGDGAGNHCDCVPNDPSSRPPNEVQNLEIWRDGVSDTRMEWSEANGADTYEVIRASLSSLASSGYGDCLAGGITALDYVDGEAPMVGDGSAYLVRGVDSGCGAGILGFTGSGIVRSDAGIGACP